MDYKTLSEETPIVAPPAYSSPLEGVQNVGFQPPLTGFSSGSSQSVTCEVCGSAISLVGADPRATLVKCKQCSRHTPIGPPPFGKKFFRCNCKELLRCGLTKSKAKCPECKTSMKVAGVIAPISGPMRALPATTSTLAVSRGTCRIVCAHCSEIMLFEPSGIAKCSFCLSVPSVGKESARMRVVIFFLLAFVLLASAIGITVGTYVEAYNRSGGYYYVWSGAYSSGLVNLLFGIRYSVIRVSYPENYVPA